MDPGDGPPWGGQASPIHRGPEQNQKAEKGMHPRCFLPACLSWDFGLLSLDWDLCHRLPRFPDLQTQDYGTGLPESPAPHAAHGTSQPLDHVSRFPKSLYLYVHLCGPLYLILSTGSVSLENPSTRVKTSPVKNIIDGNELGLTNLATCSCPSFLPTHLSEFHPPLFRLVF